MVVCCSTKQLLMCTDSGWWQKVLGSNGRGKTGRCVLPDLQSSGRRVCRGLRPVTKLIFKVLGHSKAIGAVRIAKTSQHQHEIVNGNTCKMVQNLNKTSYKGLRSPKFVEVLLYTKIASSQIFRANGQHYGLP